MKAREINDSTIIYNWLLFCTQRNCLMIYKMLEVSEMLEGITNLGNLIEASEVKSKFNSFQEWIFGQLGLLKFLKSLEGGTRVQQIITGYFVAPVSLRLA